MPTKQQKTFLFVCCICILVLVLAGGCAERKPDRLPPPDKVSWLTILRDSLDLRNLARNVEPWEQSQLWSSAIGEAGVSLTSLAAQIHGDMDHGNFLRVEDKGSIVEATLMETNGPGMITWIQSANPTGILKLYVDDKDQPVLTLPFEAFLAGSFLPVKSPFASVTSYGHNLHFPIIHRAYCRMAVCAPKRSDLAELFYQVAWNRLDENAALHTFDAAEIAHCKQTLSAISKDLSSGAGTWRPNDTPAEVVVAAASVVLKPGESTKAFVAENDGVIRALQIKPAGQLRDLMDIRVRARWAREREAAVDVPLHALLGVSEAFEETRSLPASVSRHDALCVWPMPCEAGSTLYLANCGTSTVSLVSTTYFEPSDLKKYPLRYRAICRSPRRLSTEERNIVELVSLKGAGRFVGCVLRVDSHTDRWWGEGDQVFWLDDMRTPAWQGVGTEDYFGFSWCSKELFANPFRAQTRATPGTQRGIANMNRYHIMDSLPFHRRARFEFEAWGMGAGSMDYQPTVFWYGNTPLDSETIDPAWSNVLINVSSDGR